MENKCHMPLFNNQLKQVHNWELKPIENSKTHLITSLDVFDGNELFSELISHQSRDSEISWTDISDEIVPVTVVHDRQVHDRTQC